MYLHNSLSLFFRQYGILAKKQSYYLGIVDNKKKTVAETYKQMLFLMMKWGNSPHGNGNKDL